MKYIVYFILAVSILFIVEMFISKLQTDHYVAPIQAEIVATSTPEVVVKRSVSPVVQLKDPTPSQAQIILQKSAQYGVDPVVLIDVIRCESGFKETALGDGGYSRGLVQIHSKYHPEITDEMAYDPEFAIDFLAKKVSENKGHLWTCYRNLIASR